MMHEKLVKILALANHPETSPEEAAAAAAMAAELAVKYNIDLGTIKEVGQQEKKEFKRSEWTKVKASPRDRQAALYLQSGINDLYAVQGIVTWYPPSNRFSFVGQPHNTLLATHWFEYLWDCCVRATKEYNKKRSYMSTKEKSKAEQSFRLYFCAAVQRRLFAKRQQMMQQGVKDGEGSTSTALVVVNWYEQERKELRAWMEQNFSGKTVHSRKKELDRLAAVAGQDAGKRVSLDDQVGGSARKPAPQLK